MRVFVSSRRIHERRTVRLVSQLLSASRNEVAILRQNKHDEEWKSKVEEKIKGSDFVLFIVEAETFESHAVRWEFDRSKELNKRIIGIRSDDTPEDSLLFCEGFQLFDKVEDCFAYISKVYQDDRQLLIEQYKIMVASTEKVTSQRMSVNNLFFTVTSTVISIGFLVGKELQFSIAALVGMVIFTALALLLTVFWHSLVSAYGTLNKGKFALVDKIEKRLRTDMFEEEWRILTIDMKYIPNTKTETRVVWWYRVFIVVALILEIIYLAVVFYEVFTPPIPFLAPVISRV